MAEPIDVYPVGLLADLLGLYRALRSRHPKAVRHASRRLRGQLRRNIDQARRGAWRELRSSFNGYLAEPAVFPPGVTRCGTGWTRRRALRSLDRQFEAAAARIAERNPDRG